jgi:hypothetical protein
MPKTFEVELKGVSPYLMHRYPDETADTKSQKKTGRKDYKDEAEVSLYKDEKGIIYVPSTSVEGCIVKAASDFQITGKGKKTYKDLSRSALLVRPDAIPIKPQEWTIDARPVVIQRARVMRYRPRWDNWSLKFQIDVLDDQFPEETLKEILDSAGTYKGIGDFRPKFGRFIVTSFKQVT